MDALNCDFRCYLRPALCGSRSEAFGSEVFFRDGCANIYLMRPGCQHRLPVAQDHLRNFLGTNSFSLLQMAESSRMKAFEELQNSSKVHFECSSALPGAVAWFLNLKHVLGWLNGLGACDTSEILSHMLIDIGFKCGLKLLSYKV